LGLFIGIAGNLFVSYFMEAFKVVGMSPWDWIVTAFISVVIILIVAFVFYLKIESLSKSIKKT